MLRNLVNLLYVDLFTDTRFYYKLCVDKRFCTLRLLSLLALLFQICMVYVFWTLYNQLLFGVILRCSLLIVHIEDGGHITELKDFFVYFV